MLSSTLRKPIRITPSRYDPEHVVYYYSYQKDTRRYLMVAVKYLNGEGYILTAYYVHSL